MILFYTLAIICLVSCTLLVNARNPLYSLLCLVVLFLSGSIILLSLGVDFLAYVFIIVYVGALAVLFLFVVIILDIKLGKLKNFKREIPILFFLSLFFFIYLEYSSTEFSVFNEKLIEPKFLICYDQYSTLKALGYTLYTKYVIHFVLCGLILLVAIIGAIVLTAKGRYQESTYKEKQFKQGQRFHNTGKYTN